MLKTLVKLGLSQKEAQVYLALLELGEATAQNIGQQADVNRVTTYVVLEKLMQTGLVSTVMRKKKRVFIAENPEELTNLLKQQQAEMEEKVSSLHEIMTQLKAIYNTETHKPIVRYFEGAEGLEALDRYGTDQLEAGTELLGIAPIDLIEEQFPVRRKVAVSSRVNKQIRSRMIYTHKAGAIPEPINKKELRTGVFMSRDLFPIDITLSIYPGWGVKFYHFNPKNYFGVLLQSPDIARNMQYFFELAWEAAKRKEPPRLRPKKTA